MIIYLHGFNSSPQSHKASYLGDVLRRRGQAGGSACPALPPRPLDAIRAIEAELAKHPRKPVCFVGSSLGGFYATHLAEKHDARAVLINPAIDPDTGLESYLGRQQNLYTGESWELTREHLAEWASLRVARITPSRYLLLVETGDEVLDYRRAVARYTGAKQVVIEGGDHTLKSFPEQLPVLFEFAGLDA